MVNERPSFLKSWIDAIGQSIEKRGTRAVVPIWIIVCLALGGIVAWKTPGKFWSDEYWSISTAVYGGLLTFNGIVLALSWGIFAKVYEILGDQKFSVYLRRANLLSWYIFYVGYAHLAQMVASVLSILGLSSILMVLPHQIIDQIIFAFTVGATLYSVKRSYDAWVVMNDLIWYKSIFDEHERNKENTKVVDFNGNKR